MTNHWIRVEDVIVSWITQTLCENPRQKHRILRASIIIAHDAGNAQQQAQDTPDPVLCFIHSVLRIIITDAMYICPDHEKTRQHLTAVLFSTGILRCLRHNSYVLLDTRRCCVAYESHKTRTHALVQEAVLYYPV